MSKYEITKLILSNHIELNENCYDIICEYGKNISHLDLSNCVNVNDEILIKLINSLNEINYINISNCKNITDISFLLIIFIIISLILILLFNRNIM